MAATSPVARAMRMPGSERLARPSRRNPPPPAACSPTANSGLWIAATTCAGGRLASGGRPASSGDCTAPGGRIRRTVTERTAPSEGRSPGGAIARSAAWSSVVAAAPGPPTPAGSAVDDWSAEGPPAADSGVAVLVDGAETAGAVVPAESPLVLPVVEPPVLVPPVAVPPPGSAEASGTTEPASGSWAGGGEGCGDVLGSGAVPVPASELESVGPGDGAVAGVTTPFSQVS